MKKLVIEIDLEYFDGKPAPVGDLLHRIADGVERSKYKDLRLPDTEGDVLSARISRSQSDELRSEDIIGAMEVVEGVLIFTNTDFCKQPHKRLE